MGYKNFLIQNGNNFPLLFNYHLIWLIVPKLELYQILCTHEVVEEVECPPYMKKCFDLSSHLIIIYTQRVNTMFLRKKFVLIIIIFF